MIDKSEREGAIDQTAFSRKVGAKAARKLKARRDPTPGVWFGLGMMGLSWLVRRGSDASRRGAGDLVGQTSFWQAFLDSDAAGRWPNYRLFKCLAVGGQGRRAMRDEQENHDE